MYIVLEGIVGSGKTTQVKKLEEYFKQNPPSPLSQGGTRPQVLYVREPGSTPIAEDIRYLAQGKRWEDEEMHPLTNAYLYAAARAQTLETVVKPALARGEIVISDRSFISSCAIQGEAQGLGIEKVLEVNVSAIDTILPDIIFYLDVDIDTALSRTFDEGGDKFEKEGRDFYERIIRGYEKISKWKKLEGRFVKIDASGSEDTTFQLLLHHLVGQASSLESL